MQAGSRQFESDWLHQYSPVAQLVERRMKNGKYELVVSPPEYPGKRYRGRYSYKHRVVWWKETGENPDDFPAGWLIHHKDHDYRNNVFANLAKMSVGDHNTLHAPGRTMVAVVCKNCGKRFDRDKRNVKKEIDTFCSRQCVGYYGYYGRKKMAGIIIGNESSC